MFGSTFEIAQRKSDSRSVRRFRNFVLIWTMLENADSHRYVEGNTTSSVSAATATRGYEPYIVAKNAFRLFSAKTAFAEESCTRSRNCSSMSSASSGKLSFPTWQLTIPHRLRTPALMDITGSEKPFSGKCLILRGDYRQISTVIRRGSRTHISISEGKTSLEILHYLRTYGKHENRPRQIPAAPWQVASGRDIMHIASYVGITITDSPDDIRSSPAILSGKRLHTPFFPTNIHKIGLISNFIFYLSNVIRKLNWRSRDFSSIWGILEHRISLVSIISCWFSWFLRQQIVPRHQIYIACLCNAAFILKCRTDFVKKANESQWLREDWDCNY